MRRMLLIAALAWGLAPLQALLHIMGYGQYEGKDAHHPEIRALFTREALLASEWYRERLVIKQKRDVALWQRHVRSLTAFLARAGHRDEAERLGIAGRLAHARAELERVSGAAYPDSLVGTIGADPVHRHNAYGFIYVLEGSIVMQVKGGKEVTLTPGQTFYEGPDDVHVVGRNASKTQPAKFLVFLIKDKGSPVLVPTE